MSGGKITHHTQLQYGYWPGNTGKQFFPKRNCPLGKIYFIMKAGWFAKKHGILLSGSCRRGRICRSPMSDQFRVFRRSHRGRLRSGSGVVRLIILPINLLLKIFLLDAGRFP
jgi:hypothetical protein